MATAINNQRQMVDVKGSERFKFANLDDRLEGYLIGVEKTHVQDGEVNEFVLRKLDGEDVTFLGSTDLERHLRALVKKFKWGQYVVITYLGTDPSVKTQGAAFKRFKVQADATDNCYKKRSSPNLPPEPQMGITDDDIPF